MNITQAYDTLVRVLEDGLDGSGLPVHPGPITRAAPIGPCVIVGLPASVATRGVCSWEFEAQVAVMAASADNDAIRPMCQHADQVAAILIDGGVGVSDVAEDTIDTGGPNPIPLLTLTASLTGWSP